MSSNQLTIYPDCIDQWFPTEQQRNYVSQLMGTGDRPIGLTRCRAEYFVRLWAYLSLKEQWKGGETLQNPLRDLHSPKGFIPCTHREAAEVFYAQKERGSDRAAGMMLDSLEALGLIEKQFDGNTICIQVKAPPKLTAPQTDTAPLQFQVDAFDPRSDATAVAHFLARSYAWMNGESCHLIARRLRKWAKDYPAGMRVLRRCDRGTPVGFYCFYPTTSASEKNFFLPPRQSLYLSSQGKADPFEAAVPSDEDCTSVFVRSWVIDAPYMQDAQIYQLLQDSQQVLTQMLEDFPNLSDFYSLLIHPKFEKLITTLGFQKLQQDSVLGIYWVYQALDRFLALDLPQALSDVKWGH